MARTVLAKERFEQTRKAVKRLHDVQIAIMFNCEDWKPQTVKARSGISDPTAKAAIYAVDELASKLEELRREESELYDFIGMSLALIEAVRAGLGAKYADALEYVYIDCLTWPEMRLKHGIAKTTGYERVNVACDWIDAIGVSHALKGEFEL